MTAPSGWPVLRSLSARGLKRGRVWWSSDAPSGTPRRHRLQSSAESSLGQRVLCTHFMTNLLTRSSPRRAQPWVATMVRRDLPENILPRWSVGHAQASGQRVTDQLQNRFPQVASLLDEAGPDVLARSVQLPTRPSGQKISGPTTHMGQRASTRSIRRRTWMWWASSK